MSITFFARGTPRPQGSKRSVGRGRMVEMSKGLPAWRKAVVIAAKQAMTLQRVDMIRGPVWVDLEFVMPRPRKTRHPACDVRPDIEKLARGVFDPLTMAGLIEDDCRVVRATLCKRWARESGIEAAGCLVSVRAARE